MKNIINSGEEANKLIKLLKNIDQGYKITNIEKRELELITVVNFSWMELSSLPKSIELLVNLEILYLFFNKLTFLPDSFKSLRKLKVLDLNHNRLSSLPSSFQYLVSLEYLTLGDNCLTIMPGFLSALTSLKKLELWGNYFVELPDYIRYFRNLEELYISKLPIRYIPIWIGQLSNLRKLDLQNLSLHDIPSELLNTKLQFKFEEDISEDGIYLHGTTLATQPISLFNQTRSLVENYYAEKKIEINEAKVIFLGDGDVGKTYTIKRLLRQGEIETEKNADEYKTTMTHGIIISSYIYQDNDQKIDIHFWDFGGQDIMHSMHRCFLTERTCYLVMVSTRTPDIMERARYWLRSIISFANNSPVILFVNQWENMTEKRLDESRLKKEFLNLRNIIYLSSKKTSKENFMKIEKIIVERVRELDCCGMKIPITWNAIQNKLRNIAKKEYKFYITQQEYFDICSCNGLDSQCATSNGDIRIWLLEWFNDLGICFSYHQYTSKIPLQSYKVLNPEWLTNAIYLIIMNGNQYAINGVLTLGSIKTILRHPEDGESGNISYLQGINYNSDECGYILEVMRKFSLSYSIPEKGEFIPALCPDSILNNDKLIPEQWDKTCPQHSHISYEMSYTYLPDIVVHRLMIYCQKYLRIDLCWRKGMRIDFFSFGLTAIIDIGNGNDNLSIDLYAYGNHAPWELLQPLRECILNINKELNLHSIDYVVVQGSNQKDRFKVEWLLKQKNRGRNFVSGEDDDYEVTSLLGDTFGGENIYIATRFFDENQLPIDLKRLSSITMSNCPIHIHINKNDMNYASIYTQDVNINWDFEQFLKIMVSHEEYITEKMLSSLGELFYEQQEEIIKQFGNVLKDNQITKKSKFEILRGILGDVANGITVASPIVTAITSHWSQIRKGVGQIIQTFAPILLKCL